MDNISRLFKFIEEKEGVATPLKALSEEDKLSHPVYGPMFKVLKDISFKDFELLLDSISLYFVEIGSQEPYNLIDHAKDWLDDNDFLETKSGQSDFVFSNRRFLSEYIQSLPQKELFDFIESADPSFDPYEDIDYSDDLFLDTDDALYLVQKYYSQYTVSALQGPSKIINKVDVVEVKGHPRYILAFDVYSKDRYMSAKYCFEKYIPEDSKYDFDLVLQTIVHLYTLGSVSDSMQSYQYELLEESIDSYILAEEYSIDLSKKILELLLENNKLFSSIPNKESIISSIKLSELMEIAINNIGGIYYDYMGKEAMFLIRDKIS